MKKNIDDIENILNSFDGMQRAEAKPFFHTRVLARVEKESSTENSWVPIRKPVWVIAALSFFFVVNTYLIIQQVKQTKTAKTNDNYSLQNFASEYRLNTTTDY